MTEFKKIKFTVEILYNMFYNTNNDFKMGEFVVSPILMLTADSSAMFTTTVVVSGILIVVGVLLLLIEVFQLFGKVAPKIEAATKRREEKRAARKAERKAGREAKKAEKMLEKNTESAVTKTAEIPKAVPAVKPIPASNTPIVEQGISGEIVAAITAAIVASEGADVVVRSIRRKNVIGRNPWAQAANIDNTRPF